MHPLHRGGDGYREQLRGWMHDALWSILHDSVVPTTRRQPWNDASSPPPEHSWWSIRCSIFCKKMISTESPPDPDQTILWRWLEMVVVSTAPILQSNRMVCMSRRILVYTASTPSLSISAEHRCPDHRASCQDGSNPVMARIASYSLMVTPWRALHKPTTSNT